MRTRLNKQQQHTLLNGNISHLKYIKELQALILDDMSCFSDHQQKPACDFTIRYTIQGSLVFCTKFNKAVSRESVSGGPSHETGWVKNGNF